MYLSSYSKVTFLFVFSALLLTSITALAENKADDKDALQGVEAIKAVYDVRVNEPKIITLFLQVIEQTYNDLIRQGHRPNFVVTFRGPAAIAAGLFKVDPKTFIPEVKPVGNTFISLIGYQAKGYGLVPIN